MEAPAVNPWLLAIRPRTLPASAAPVAVGIACAVASGRALHAGAAVAALVGALLLQIAANLANDVFDAEKGADTVERLGPVRVVAAGLLPASAVRAATVGVLAAAFAVGVYLVSIGGWPIVAVGLASIAAALAYTGGPWPLGYHGLGDVCVMAFFGFAAVCGTAYVVAGDVPPSAWIAALAPGALATNLLVINNLRDRETDARAGKRTLAVRGGRTFAVGEHAAMLALAYAAPVIVVLAGASRWALLPIVTAPIAVALHRAVARSDGRALNPLLGRTAGLLVLHSALFAVGLLVGGRG
jgi:1,4-dihydroxy-2-naphthoate octaprenyltransferase